MTRHLLPAVVQTTVDVGAAGDVLVDGDDVTIEVINATGQSLSSGSRVLVDFVQPAGAFILGVLSHGGDDAYELVTFTADGTFTKGDYPWMRSCRVTVQGGGGAGGGGKATSAGEHSMGSGGGAGAMAIASISRSGLSTDTTVQVATAAVGSSGADGGGGGTSYFGSTFCSAGGGYGGYARANSSTPHGVRGGAGGTATYGDVWLHGGPGHECWGDANDLGYSGNGASSPIGGGGGVGKNTSASGQSYAGNDAVSYGAGGGGGICSASASVNAGGDGGAGIVLVELFG